MRLQETFIKIFEAYSDERAILDKQVDKTNRQIGYINSTDKNNLFIKKSFNVGKFTIDVDINGTGSRGIHENYSFTIRYKNQKDSFKKESITNFTEVKNRILMYVKHLAAEWSEFEDAIMDMLEFKENSEKFFNELEEICNTATVAQNHRKYTSKAMDNRIDTIKSQTKKVLSEFRNELKSGDRVYISKSYNISGWAKIISIAEKFITVKMEETGETKRVQKTDIIPDPKFSWGYGGKPGNLKYPNNFD